MALLICFISIFRKVTNAQMFPENSDELFRNHFQFVMSFFIRPLRYDQWAFGTLLCPSNTKQTLIYIGIVYVFVSEHYYIISSCLGLIHWNGNGNILGVCSTKTIILPWSMGYLFIFYMVKCFVWSQLNVSQSTMTFWRV